MLCAGLFASSLPAHAQSLAPGDPATLLELDNEFVGDLAGPTAFAFLPDGSMVITEKEGQVWLRASGGTLADAGQFTVDSGSEKGLLNVLPHPDFADNRLLFFYYSRAGGDDLNKHRVVTVRLGDNGMLDMASENLLVENLRGPANHDGGALALSPDGQYLYIGVGDTGCNTGQPPSAMVVGNYFGTCLTNGNGKVLRVAIDGSIPSDNPLASLSAVTACGTSCGNEPTTTAAPRTDIWAWGFRNPWRIWADPETGNLWVGDVGEVTYEEINVVAPAGGKHHGWPFREGNQGSPPARCSDITPDVGDCVDPAYFCSHGGGADGDCGSITGGLIVDHCSWPAPFRGRYFFGDYDTGRTFSLDVNADRSGVVAGSRATVVTGGSPVHYAVGPDGALYGSSIMDGAIFRIAPQTPEECVMGAGGNGGGGATGSGGEGGTSSSDDGGDDGGCGCRNASSSTSRTSALLLAAALGAIFARRHSARVTRR